MLQKIQKTTSSPRVFCGGSLRGPVNFPAQLRRQIESISNENGLRVIERHAETHALVWFDEGEDSVLYDKACNLTPPRRGVRAGGVPRVNPQSALKVRAQGISLVRLAPIGESFGLSKDEQESLVASLDWHARLPHISELYIAASRIYDEFGIDITDGKDTRSEDSEFPNTTLCLRRVNRDGQLVLGVSRDGGSPNVGTLDLIPICG